MTSERMSHNDPTAPLGVLVIGCGYWGANYVRIFGELPEARLVAACDASPDRLHDVGSSRPDVFLTTDLDAALALPEVQVAVICTPADTHRDVAERCLRAGVHALVEKPLTTLASDADVLIDLAAHERLVLMTGHTFVYNAGIRKVKEYVDDGTVGRLYCLYARRTSMGPIRHDVNALWDLAPHDISIFNYLLGAEPDWVSATASGVLREDRADIGFITLGYGAGVVANIHVSWVDPNKTREVVAVGSKRRIVFDDLNALERVRVFEKGVGLAPSAASTYGEYNLLLRDGDIFSPVIEVNEPLKTQCLHFLECVSSGESPQLTGGIAGRGVVRVMEAVDQSVALGGAPVALGAVREQEVHLAGPLR
jgi:predicted dehydrogenase